MSRHASIMYKHPFSQACTHASNNAAITIGTLQTRKMQKQQILKHNNSWEKNRGCVLDRIYSQHCTLLMWGPDQFSLPWVVVVLSLCHWARKPQQPVCAESAHTHQRSETRRQYQEYQESTADDYAYFSVLAVSNQCLSLLSCKDVVISICIYSIHWWTLSSLSLSLFAACWL